MVVTGLCRDNDVRGSVNDGREEREMKQKGAGQEVR